MSFFQGDEIREEELAALADGSLPAERRAFVEERVAASPELQAALEEQRHAVVILHGMDVEAPASLRARVEAQRRGRTRPRRFTLGLGFAAVAAAAAAAVLLLVTLPGGVSGPSLAEAASLATLPPSQPAPQPSATEPKLLDADLDGVVFPSWDEKFEWDAVGARTDEIGGRETKTVFYEKEGKRIAYTIVGGDALDVPADARPARREGTDVIVLEAGDRSVVTWERDGKTCILSGKGVPAGTLVKLAAWKGKGAVEF
jgi:hypothetical protein